MATRNSTKNSDLHAATNEGVLHDSAGLEFPDWNGKLPHQSRLTFEQAVQWNEEMLSQFPLERTLRQSDVELPCHVEFFL